MYPDYEQKSRESQVSVLYSRVRAIYPEYGKRVTYPDYGNKTGRSWEKRATKITEIKSHKLGLREKSHVSGLRKYCAIPVSRLLEKSEYPEYGNGVRYPQYGKESEVSKVRAQYPDYKNKSNASGSWLGNNVPVTRPCPPCPMSSWCLQQKLGNKLY